MPSIRILPVTLDGAPIADPAKVFRPETQVLARLALAIARGCEKLPAFQALEYKLDEATASACGLPLQPECDIQIELVLTDDDEALDHWDAPPGSLGLHALSAGAFEYADGDFLSGKHRVVVLLDAHFLQAHLIDQRAQEFDPTIDRYDRDHLYSYLTTITHELAHCVEFIQHANGATPGHAGNLMEEGVLDLHFYDLTSGHGILFPFDESLSRETLNDIMEDRVEATGRRWLREIDLPEALIAAALETYGPDEKSIDSAHGDWPIFDRSEQVLHVGDLRKSRPAVRHSLEGAGLSVSYHPGAWTAIARLAGGKTYALAKAGAQFMDMLSLLQNKDLMGRVRDWGLKKGLIQTATLYRVTRFDDELGEDVQSLFAAAEEAHAEAEEGARVEAIDGFIATKCLAQLQRQPSIDPLCVDDMVALAYAHYELKLDGAWWFEALDELAYSAPRGVVFEPGNGWDITCLDDPGERVSLGGSRDSGLDNEL